MATAYEIADRHGRILQWVPTHTGLALSFGYANAGRPVRYASPEGAAKGKDIYLGTDPGEIIPVEVPDENVHW